LKPNWSNKFNRKKVIFHCLFILKPYPNILYLIEYKDQLMALDIIPGNLDLVDKAFADLKVNLDGEKASLLVA
jgi:hypothetical protein